jgi:uncharacterized membrane protein YfcA
MTELTVHTAEKFLAFILLGFGTGLYGTLIGAGGGFVLMPILLLLYPHKNPEHLTSVSLAVVFFNALGGSEVYALMRRIDYRSGLMFAAATIPGAVAGALITSYVSRSLFDAIFGIALASASAFLVMRSNVAEEARAVYSRHYHVERHIVFADGDQFVYSFNPMMGIGLSFVVGFLSSFLGIGGGIIHVPALTYLLGFHVHVATATSHFILAIMAFAGTLTHIVDGTFGHDVDITLSLAIGVVLGAPLGAYLSNRIRGNWIVRGLALALGLVGLRMILATLF